MKPSPQSSYLFNDKRRRPPHVRDFLLAEMTARGWRVRDLAARMGEDHLRNRALLFHYLRHPTGDLELGAMFAERLGQALELSGQFFLDLEKAWRADQRALAA